MVSMINYPIYKEVAAVRNLSAQSLKILEGAYNAIDGRETISRNFHIRKEQDEMLTELARYNHETKVTVLKFIIDEWREMKMREVE